MKVILDTNIYLNFFRETDNQPLLYVKALLELIKNKKFQLILPVQVRNEFLINKEDVIKWQINKINSGLNVTMQLPVFIEKSQEGKGLKSAIKMLGKLKNRTVKEYERRSLDPKSKINTGINKLFRVAKEVDGTEIIQRAHFRTLQGYPPRKSNRSFGDAIIWETLLEYCADDDLIVVSNDIDYRPDKNSEIIHSFLATEWANKTNGKTVKLYRNLGKFINDNSPQKKKPITKELIEREELQLYGGIFDVEKTYKAQYIKFPEKDLKHCDCCGVIFQQNPYSLNTLVGNVDRCTNCAVGEGKTCHRCGKHYHDSFDVFVFESSCVDTCPSCRLLYPGEPKVVWPG